MGLHTLRNVCNTEGTAASHTNERHTMQTIESTTILLATQQDEFGAGRRLTLIATVTDHGDANIDVGEPRFAIETQEVVEIMGAGNVVLSEQPADAETEWVDEAPADLGAHVVAAWREFADLGVLGGEWAVEV